jgi:uncharacterized protein (DUF3820 family)
MVDSFPFKLKIMPVTYTDSSQMPFGIHQGKKLIDVPAKYLLYLWDSPTFDKKSTLGLYIEDNLQVLKSQDKQR